MTVNKHARTDTQFGRDLIASLKEVVAHARGEVALPTRVLKPNPKKVVRTSARKNS